MNSNYRRQKPSILHFQRQQKIANRNNSNLLSKQHYEHILSQAKNGYEQQKDLQKAIKGFEQYLQANPNHDEAAYLCGVCLMQLQQFQNAVSKFERVSDLYCLKHNALLLASMAFNKMGNTPKSYQLANQCIRRHPLFQEALCFRAKLHIQMAQYIHAESDFKNTLKINPHSFLALIGLGDCCRYFYKYLGAIDFYNKSLKVINKQGKQHSSKEIMESEIRLKIGICYYFLQRYNQCAEIMKDLSVKQKMSCSQLYYYFGLCQLKLNERDKGISNLQHSIRLDSNALIIEKAYKKLILLYLQNYQFYEAQTTIKMGSLYNIKAKEWQNLIGLCMLVIKSNYIQGLQGINQLYNLMKDQKPSQSVLKFDKEDNTINKINVPTNRYQSLFMKKASLQNSSRFKRSPKSKEQQLPLLTKIKRSIDKIESLRINKNAHRSQQFPLKLRFKTQYYEPQQKAVRPFSEKDKEIVYPILLQFKAYCQFFNHQMENCIETFQQYEAYIQNHFGKQSNVKYSKCLCQVFLLLQADEPEQALIKCNQSIDLYFQKYGSEPVEPILYKISILIKIAMASVLSKGEECKAESNQILSSTLEMIQSKPALHSCSIAQYYTAIIFILMQQYQKGRECMRLAVKLSEQCTFNILYSKAILQLKMGYYIVAFKDISNSIMIKKTSGAYLVKCLILLRFSEQQQPLRRQVLNLIKQDSAQQEEDIKSINLKFIREYIVQKCLDELKNYIEQCFQDQDEIAIWVTKILFACRSFDQALLSFDKIKPQYHQEINIIAQCLSIYSGDFQKGGKTGQIIKQSFDACFLTEQQQNEILKRFPIKDYSQAEFGYLDLSYEKWLIVLHLYMKEQYNLCIQYIQMLLNMPQMQEQTEFLLRYDLAILYFIVNDYPHAFSTIDSLQKFDQIFNVRSTIERMQKCDFVNDECLGEVSSCLFFRSLKMLSSYLSYKSINLVTNNREVKVYARISIPFPPFYKPDLQVQFDTAYILSQLSISHIPKRIQAPWIKRVKNSIQFTEQLTNTIISFESKTNQEESINFTRLQQNQSTNSIL